MPLRSSETPRPRLRGTPAETVPAFGDPLKISAVADVVRLIVFDVGDHHQRGPGFKVAHDAPDEIPLSANSNSVFLDYPQRSLDVFLERWNHHLPHNMQHGGFRLIQQSEHDESGVLCRGII